MKKEGGTEIDIELMVLTGIVKAKNIEVIIYNPELRSLEDIQAGDVQKKKAYLKERAHPGEVKVELRRAIEANGESLLSYTIVKEIAALLNILNKNGIPVRFPNRKKPKKKGKGNSKLPCIYNDMSYVQIKLELLRVLEINGISLEAK